MLDAMRANGEKNRKGSEDIMEYFICHWCPPATAKKHPQQVSEVIDDHSEEAIIVMCKDCKIDEQNNMLGAWKHAP